MASTSKLKKGAQGELPYARPRQARGRSRAVPVTLRQAHAAVVSLVRDFQAHRPAYHSAEYSEAQARTDFIDKFFTALGWDVAHNFQRNPFEQEVKVENRVSVDGTQRRADYAFFLAPNHRDVQFFVEAKKPCGNLESADSHFQALRYGWNSSTPLAFLTDFEFIHVLDCRSRPNVETASQHVVWRYRCDDWTDEEKFAEVYYLLSHEAVENGSISKAVEKLKSERVPALQRSLFSAAHQTIDEAFLVDLDGYRDELARSLKARNQELDGPELTEITQRILDRLVFLRFLEDKQIETKESVGKLGSRGSAWKDFIATSRRLDSIYNGAVYKRHPLLDGGRLEIDDAVFAGICGRLSDDKSPYNFDIIPIHILGSIYERFLGKVIVTTDKRARVEPKPEVRRAGGVYYTPEYVVRKIVEETVGHQLRGRTPEEIAKLRFADISCGSGSFLLGVYEHLLRYHAAWYNANPSRAKRGDCVTRTDGALHLSLKKKREILLNNIFGVDIDVQAVEVAQLSLYLKLLEDETPSSTRNYQMEISEALLPSMNKNIVCGNSLIEPSTQTALWDSEEELALSPLDMKRAFPSVFKAGGFDAVLGNPPYDVMEKERGEASWPHHKLAEYAKRREDLAPALGGKLNLFRFFVIRMVRLAKPGGSVGMIIPLAVLGDLSCAATRRFLMLELEGLGAYCFPQKDSAANRIFHDAKISTVVLTGLRREAPSEAAAQIAVRVFPRNRFDDRPRSALISYGDAILIDHHNVPIPLVDEQQWELCLKLHSAASAKPLREVADFAIRRGEINQTNYRQFITEDPSHLRMLKGAEVARYRLNAQPSQGRREWFDEDSFVKRGGEPKPVSRLRRIATQRITGVDEKWRVVAAIVEPDCYFADSTNSIALNPGSRYPLEVLLGLLNSRLFQWRFKLTSTNNNVGTNELEALPFPDFLSGRRKVQGAAWVEKMAAQVTSLMQMHGRLPLARKERDREFIERSIARVDSEIDLLVFEAFGLTSAEKDLVNAEWEAGMIYSDAVEPASAVALG